MFLYDRKAIENIPQNNWKYKAYNDFKSIIQSDEREFPCTLGVAGFSADQLRFAFIDEAVESSIASEQLAATLQTFVPNARSFGKNTSLVVFFAEDRDLGIEKYEHLFWKIIDSLHALDARPWPLTVPHNPNHKDWEFSFAGEPIFAVCNTPSHKIRRSRYSGTFMLTFQPRWVFDGVIGKYAKNSEKIKKEIRRRLHNFDAIPPSPDLGAYGDIDNREWKQYFLRENNDPRVDECPFKNHSAIKTPHVQKTEIIDIVQVIQSLLPPTGAVEVQIDTPFRTHTWHQHPTDETLHIIQGEISFQLQDKTARCKAGDRLLLPANTPHASTAGVDGCLYVIATRLIPAKHTECKKSEIEGVYA